MNKNFISAFTYLLLFLSLQFKSFGQNEAFDLQNGWKQLKTVEKEIIYPQFQNKDYSILDFGAQAIENYNNSEAFRKTIETCSKNGGGRVIVPKGKFLTGPIHLENNVNLHLEEGSEILFSTNPDDYYPLVHTSFEGLELMNYSPLIYAFNKKNIAVTGKGVLNGQADKNNWWPWKGSNSENIDFGYKVGGPSQQDESNLPQLMLMAENNTPVDERVFGKNHYLRPNFIEPFECENILIQGIKIINAPFWIIHPVKSKNITIDGVHIESHGPNNDGCDPEYSKNVLIKNCIFNTGDDCIAIKAGRDSEGRRIAIKSENIIVRDCKMIDGHGGVVIGSEMSAGVSNVFVVNCIMDSPNLDRAIRIKTNTKRGGTVDGLYVRNLKVGKVKESVLRINMNYSVYGNQTGNFIPEVKNIYLQNITVEDGGKYAIYADGLEKSKIKNVVLNNVKIKKVKEPFSITHIENLKITNSKINNQKIEHY
ncbi:MULTISPECIES: glycoside hydrolase family 28 protein [Flavobacterium]|uniref:Exopolygalacturonase PelB n=1 Tax=Flavobacterium hankyongi TaxID=1176532 RepID=A0ABP8ZMX4_9FLAO|nr:glycoside hydrolase family 28 protein [Flavobacterium sp. N1846]